MLYHVCACLFGIVPILVNASVRGECPKVLLHNLKPEYHLDIGESIEVWAKLIPEPWEDNRVLGTLSNGSLLAFSMTSVEEPTRFTGVVARNVTVSVMHKGRSASTYTTKSFDTGVAYFHIKPVAEALKCSDIGVSSKITVGCHPERCIKLRNVKFDGCDEYKNFSYVISRDQMKSASTDKVVKYDFQTLGCPIEAPFSELFRPKLELFDGSKLIGEVWANFVLREQQQRTGFKYSATMQQAGCRSEAQTWQKLTQSGQPNWTRENYRSCFEDGSTQTGGNLKHQYEIVNSSGVSFLRWQTSGIYHFQVTVVDPSYSFCNLATEFAVLVHGIGPISSRIPTFLVLGLSCVTLLLFLVTAYHIMSLYSDFQ